MRRTLIATFAMCSFASFSQNVELSKRQLNINVLAPSVSYEGKIAENKSFTLAVAIGVVVEISSTNGNSETNLFAIPIVNSSFRRYYSRQNIKKENLRPNSGNYIGFFAGYHFNPIAETDFILISQTNVYVLGAVWGFERNYANGWHLGLSLGPGIVGSGNVRNDFTILGEFELGFTIFTK